MNEETKEYLKRVDELELKLTGDDKDTFQWVLFGYNECARILEETEQENKQLEHNWNELKKWLESWLENDKYCYLAENPVDKCRCEVYKELLDKMQELEEGGNNDC